MGKALILIEQTLSTDEQSLNGWTYRQRKSDEGVKDVCLAMDVTARSIGPYLQQLLQNVVVGKSKVGSLDNKGQPELCYAE